MEHDFEIIRCDVVNNKILTMEVRFGADGRPEYKVGVLKGGRPVEAIYSDLDTASSTFNMMKLVI